MLVLNKDQRRIIAMIYPLYCWWIFLYLTFCCFKNSCTCFSGWNWQNWISRVIVYGFFSIPGFIQNRYKGTKTCFINLVIITKINTFYTTFNSPHKYLWSATLMLVTPTILTPDLHTLWEIEVFNILINFLLHNMYYTKVKRNIKEQILYVLYKNR